MGFELLFVVLEPNAGAHNYFYLPTACPANGCVEHRTCKNLCNKYRVVLASLISRRKATDVLAKPNELDALSF